jgi:hypothetical protein
MLERKAVKGRSIGIYKIIITECIKIYKLINPRRIARGVGESNHNPRH